MNDALMRLMVNLKNWSWNVEPQYKIDENEAKEIIKEIKKIKEKKKWKWLKETDR